MRQQDDIASLFPQKLFREQECNLDARIRRILTGYVTATLLQPGRAAGNTFDGRTRQPSSLPKIEKSIGRCSTSSPQPASDFQRFLTAKGKPELRSNGNSQKRNIRTAIHAAGGRQEICAVLAWREGLGSCAPYTEEASGEDLQRCSVQEFATMSFASRV
jgi:hypothetical protein